MKIAFGSPRQDLILLAHLYLQSNVYWELTYFPAVLYAFVNQLIKHFRRQNSKTTLTTLTTLPLTLVLTLILTKRAIKIVIAGPFCTFAMFSQCPKDSAIHSAKSFVIIQWWDWWRIKTRQLGSLNIWEQWRANIPQNLLARPKYDLSGFLFICTQWPRWPSGAWQLFINNFFARGWLPRLGLAKAPTLSAGHESTGGRHSLVTYCHQQQAQQACFEPNVYLAILPAKVKVHIAEKDCTDSLQRCVSHLLAASATAL